MNAVMARILGLAGSGGALRWARRAGTEKINAAQKKTENRKLPRRIVGLQLGRSSAAPLHDTGFGSGASRISSRVSDWRSMLRRYKRGHYTKAEMPVMRSPITSLWMSLVPS